MNSIPSEFRNVYIADCDELPHELTPFSLDWVKSQSKKSLYISGVYGAGKTTYVFALINTLLKHLGSSTYFWPTYFSAKKLDHVLLQALRHLDGDEYVLEDLSTRDLLFVDDIDKINVTERNKAQICEIINRRYMYDRPTIFTSNHERSELTELFDGSVISRMRDLRKWYSIQFPDKDIRKILSLRSLK